MKFIHIADAHLGGWREEKMRAVSIDSFLNMVDIIIKEKVDFLLISGDLFNTSHPGIDILKIVVNKLRILKENNIPVYIVAGSHDFSPSGKTMLDVLEEAELLVNVVKGDVINDKLHLKFTKDPSGAKITGMLGKKGSLEKKYYQDLDRKSLESEEGFKIFMFHTSIEELKPKSLEKMDAEPVSILPRGFDYYAGGHIHIIENKSLENHKNVVYPGPIYPNNFKELEELKQGSYILYKNGDVNIKKIPSKEVLIFNFDCKNKQARQVEEDALEEFKKHDFKDKIILLRFRGKLLHSKTNDIDFKNIINRLYDDKAYFVMRNTFHLKSEDFDEIQVQEESVEKIEEKLIDEHTKNFQNEDVKFEKNLIKNLLDGLSSEKMEGETNTDFESRIIKEIDEIIKLK